MRKTEIVPTICCRKLRQSDVMSGRFWCKKGLQESLSWRKFLSFKQFICMKWRRITRPIKLLSRIFRILNKKTNYLTNKNAYIFGKKINKFWLKKRNVSYRTYLDEIFWKILAWYIKNGWLVRHLVLLNTGQTYHGMILIIFRRHIAK